MRLPGSISIMPSTPGSPSTASSLVLLPAPLTSSALWNVASRNVYPPPQVDAPDPAVEVKLESLPKRLAEVFEIAETGLFRRDEEDIVAIVRAEPRRRSISGVTPARRALPPQTSW